MKLNLILAGVALFDATASAIAIPGVPDIALTDRDIPDHLPPGDASTSFFSDLWKRKGGGGSGGKGGSSGSSSGGSRSGSGSSSSGSSSGSSSSSSSGKTGSSSSSGSSSGKGSTSSSTGGRTTTGSGAAPSYGGGRYYGGGTTVPYRSGARTTGGISPLPFVFAGTALAFWPGLWYHPAYIYPYANPWYYHNATTDKNETKPVKCGCDQYQECGCDDNNSTDYINSVLGNGSYSQLNQSLVTVANVNGTDTILVNGTLPNGTTASGGTDDPNAGAGLRHLAEAVGYWPMAATVLAVVFFY